MNLDEVRRAINFRINKDYSGQSLSPVKFNDILPIVNLEVFKLRYGLPEDFEKKSYSARQAWEVARKISDDLRPFLVSMDGYINKPLTIDSDGIAQIPSDYAHVSAILFEYRDGDDTKYKKVQPLNNANFNARKTSYILRPRKAKPVCTFRSGTIQFAPNDLKFVSFDYLRLPKKPVYAVTYDTTLEVEVYDPANSVELEWPELVHPDIVAYMVSYCADNLQMDKLKQSAEIRKGIGI